MLSHIRSDVLPRKTQYILLSFMPLYFIVTGLFIQPLETIIPGIWTLMIEPDFLITDYFVVGGIGSAFINAGLLTLMCFWVAYFLGLEMEGHTITSAYLMFGFALFGKNLMNVWSIMIGVLLYSWYSKTSISRYLYVGFYGTALSPIITQIMNLEFIPTPFNLLVGILLGLVMGFVLPPLESHVRNAHQGYSLYNVGFACGIIATVVVSVLRSLGLEVGYRTLWYSGGNKMLSVVLYVFFVGLMVIGLVANYKQTFQGFLRIIKKPGLGGTDYIKDEGLFPVGFNMGLNGIIATTIVLAVGGQLNGPTIGGIMTVTGFGAIGKHFRNILPVMLGIIIASIFTNWNLTDPVPMLALLFCTTLAPIAGEFGVIAGIIAGMLHSAVALTIGSVYAGMNLYNNGFAGGFVAIFLVPLLKSIRDRRAQRRGTFPCNLVLRKGSFSGMLVLWLMK